MGAPLVPGIRRKMTETKAIAEMMLLMREGIGRGKAKVRFRHEWGLDIPAFDRVWAEAEKLFHSELEVTRRSLARNMVSGLDDRIVYATMKREEALEILAQIARGKIGAQKKIKNIDGDDEIINLPPTVMERISAIKMISEIEGWDAPIKIESSSVVEFRDAE